MFGKRIWGRSIKERVSERISDYGGRESLIYKEVIGVVTKIVNLCKTIS